MCSAVLNAFWYTSKSRKCLIGRFSGSPCRRVSDSSGLLLSPMFICFCFLLGSPFRLSPIRRFLLTEIPQRTLHFRFRIDEKVRAGDDTFAFGQSALHFVVI